MELWIRSQDKKRLANIKQLYIEKYEYKNTSGIYGQTTNDNHIQLGVYWPEERASEVLDEIQKLLQPQILIKKGKIAGSFDNTIIREADGFEIKELSTYVYEMPKD